MRNLSLTLLIAIVSTFYVNADNALPDDFDTTVLAEMEKWHAPGLGLAVVKDGKTLLAKGYGIKSIKTNELVNADTVFQAGSTTKAFASMAVAMLIDDGVLSWDDPIIKHIPEFQMKDKYVQNNLTLRDAFSHNSGVSFLSNVNMFLSKNLDSAWGMMSANNQQASFRRVWDYNNTIFALSGRVVERVTGKPFHQFVRERIFRPLGMNNSLLLDAEVATAKNRAEAHQRINGQDYQIIYPYIEYSQAAGMLNSTPNDMAKWMTFLTAGGVWEGERLVSEAHVREMMSPQMLLKPESIYPAAASYTHDYYAYGLAWFVHDYAGEKVAMHTGSINGMSAILGLIPDHNIGVYVFINSDHIEYRHALMYKVFDLFLGNEGNDWSSTLYDVYHPEAQSAPTGGKVTEHPDVSIDALKGTYDLKGSYPLIIRDNGGKLVAHLGVTRTDLVRQADNSYLLVDPENPDLPSNNNLGIIVNDEGRVSALTLSGLTFTRRN
ncbi:serine hydrolase domain-containing protein [Kordiimonas aquimaris]|uniref:serine hydrolase domain-containing protein n=1 Tax=Kordiimonas aquimaris TaxID=707591 RepID=UPI0021D011D9|nr:serine hydrolase [Kordiimonas aquimaris]